MIVQKQLVSIFCIVALALVSCQPKTGNTNQGSATESETATTDQPVNDTLRGIDVSHFNGSVDWSIVKNAGFDFAYAKATQGNDFVDPEFNYNWSNMATNGIKRGAYHFYVATDDPTTQAQHFIATVTGFTDADMPVMVDLEGANIGGVDVATYQQDVLKWLQLVEEHFGVQPILYTDNPFADQFLQNEAFASYKLWIADYAPGGPTVPAPWKHWHMWQRTGSLTISGLQGNFDEDLLVN